jgi:hypothetical protein
MLCRKIDPCILILVVKCRDVSTYIIAGFDAHIKKQVP